MGESQRELSSYRRNGARERLIESHLPLVQSVARRYAGRGETLDDLVQVGSIGLIKASDRFDPSRGVAFGKFAASAIEGEIRRHLRDRASTLRIPRELQRMGGRLRRRHEELAAELGRAPTVPELAAALGADEADVEGALAAERARDPIPIASGEDAIDLPDAAEPISSSEDRLLLERGARVLDERARQIVFLRFHADMTERQIARAVGLSQAHVSRLLEASLAKLRAELAVKDRGTASPVISRERSTARRSSAGDAPGADTRIAPVGAPQENPTLARYLNLPYHVAVRSKRNGSRSWWSATVEELPGCAADGKTPDEAVQRLRPAMESWLSSALAEDREIPVPSRETAKPDARPSHSGRFLVRMPSTLHEQLARAAERDHVSLNRFVTDALASSVAPARQVASGDERPAPDPEPDGGRASGPRLRLVLATNLIVVVVAGAIAVVLLVLALERGI
jgi:RNA polymerase sigma-B factor